MPKKVGNLPNLIISSQDGKVAGCDLSFLGASDAWNQASQSNDCPFILLIQICGSIGGLTTAPALLWGTVGPGEGGGEALVGSSSVEEQAETAPWLNSPGTKQDQQITQPSLPPNQVLTRPPINISNFLLALLYLLNLLKQCTDCCVWFSNFYQAAHNGIKVSNCVHSMISHVQ